MAAVWHYGEPFYVKLYRVVPGGPNAWVGWLGNAGVESDYAQPVAGPEDVPPTGSAKVQWVVDAQRGDATDEKTYEKELAERPRYLTSDGRVLDGSGHKGKYLYWHSADIGDKGYALTIQSTDDDYLVTVSRESSIDPAGSVICTAGDSYLYYYGEGNATILLEFVSASNYSRPAKHENWIRDRNAIIGDRPLTKIVIPGSHDAGSYQISRAGGEMTSRAQQVDVMSQLLAGSRFLDLRTDMYQDVWYMHHGADWTDVRFEHVVEQLGTFLDDHPDEFVLVELLVADVKGVPGMSGNYRKAWNMLFSRVHEHLLNYADEAGNKTDITTVTPNSLKAAGKNLLVFSWGEATSWHFDVDTASGDFLQDAEKSDPLASGATRIFVSPWESKPEGEKPEGHVADLEGVYLDPSVRVVQAADIYEGYLDYQGTGGLWNLQTNVPWQLYNYQLSLYDGHLRVTPALVYYLQLRKINNDKANIINMDYLGDVVINVAGSHDLVSAVIAANVASKQPEPVPSSSRSEPSSSTDPARPLAESPRLT
jgi:hypothetical protein